MKRLLTLAALLAVLISGACRTGEATIKDPTFPPDPIKGCDGLKFTPFIKCVREVIKLAEKREDPKHLKIYLSKTVREGDYVVRTYTIKRHDMEVKISTRQYDPPIWKKVLTDIGIFLAGAGLGALLAL